MAAEDGLPARAPHATALVPAWLDGALWAI